MLTVSEFAVTIMNAGLVVENRLQIINHFAR